jgi:5-methylcytosine-specific restriction endonuclease McrA
MSKARAALARVDEAACRTWWDGGGVAWSERHVTESHAGRTKGARDYIPNAIRRELAERDGWRCRYCGVRLLAFDFIKALNRVLPTEFPLGRRDLDRHAAALVLRYSQDHVVPVSLGGSNDLNNLVATCAVCNFQKGSCTIEELLLLDPRECPPVVDSWDGLADRFGPLGY